jgi:hypothetical protein
VLIKLEGDLTMLSPSLACFCDRNELKPTVHLLQSELFNADSMLIGTFAPPTKTSSPLEA